MLYFYTEKNLSPSIITWWFLFCCSVSFVSCLVISESNAPGLCLHLKSDNSSVFFYFYKGQEVPGTSRKPSVPRVTWATCTNHEKVNCGREAKPWHTRALRPKSSSTWSAKNSRNGHVLFKVSVCFVQCHLCIQVWIKPRLKIRTQNTRVFLLLCQNAMKSQILQGFKTSYQTVCRPLVKTDSPCILHTSPCILFFPSCGLT